MVHRQPTPREQRRRANRAARLVFEEARRAGLVRRHLVKLRHLDERDRSVRPDATAEAAASAPTGGHASRAATAPGTAAPPGGTVGRPSATGHATATDLRHPDGCPPGTGQATAAGRETAGSADTPNPPPGGGNRDGTTDTSPSISEAA
jgi:hypothetical protein